MSATPATEEATVSRTLIIDTITPYPTSQKPIVAANYSFPGPLIEAYEGDTLIIRVINKLAQPTTVHWHGMSQNGTQDMDGAVGATQCPIPSKAEMIYTFKASPAGTAWYHGHHLDQYADGLIGPLIIRRQVEPNQEYYDTERILMVADWYNDLARTKLLSWYLSASNPKGIEPIPDAIVVNGKFSQSLFVQTNGATRIRFRIINAAAFSMYTFSIDGLPLHIIELDQTPVMPYIVSSFVINAAQRVSFYVNMNEFDQNFVPAEVAPTKSIYIRFQAMPDMYPADISSYIPPYATPRYPYPTFFNPLYLAILSLNSQNSIPTYPVNQEQSSHPSSGDPEDVNILRARPFYQAKNIVPDATHYLKLVITFAPDSSNITRGYFNNVTYGPPANNVTTKTLNKKCVTSNALPLLYQMATTPNGLGIPSPIMTSGSSLPVIQSDGNGHYLIPYGAVVDIFLENRDAGEHPFHSHGYNFWIISTSENPQAEELYRGAYLQRDVVSVPSLGWAKIRLLANNPGAWLFHCHIEWHMDAGLVIAFIVGPNELLAQGYTIKPTHKRLC
ncbi:unnamed protein product [Rotaria sp. Silwood2]|nr:unnamed protein product [Rotaria sp. Silwood2]CAF2946881.1 unnamed protein product [Rotaria sp. Silwood2]CAF2974247.1 unnamed protein product [Rotaria sp. Silwood2]CAF4212226.1 unnamed protein product [Rotaria sp. Silwood2]CAF4321100.1 unnamed protein product [Rotaria sp. Silwood2]